MEKTEFISLFAESLEIDNSEIDLSVHLDALETWDSLAELTFISLVDEKTGVTPSPEKIKAAVTGDDLWNLVNDINVEA